MSFAREASFRVRTAERYTCLKGHLNSQTQLAMRQASAKAPYAALAQLVEHRIRNAGVVGSNPIGGTTTSSSKFQRFLAKGHKTQCPTTF